MALDPADYKFFAAAPKPTVDPADRKFTPPFATVNNRQLSILDRLPDPAKVYLDPTYRIPVTDVMKMIGIAESGGRWDYNNPDPKSTASGQFQFLKASEKLVGEYLHSLGLIDLYDKNNQWIPIENRPPEEQEAFFRVFAYMPYGKIPGANPGLQNWQASSGRPGEDQYPHTWDTTLPDGQSKMDKLSAIYNSPSARESYDRLLNEYLTIDNHVPSDMTVIRTRYPQNQVTGPPVGNPFPQAVNSVAAAGNVINPQPVTTQQAAPFINRSNAFSSALPAMSQYNDSDTLEGQQRNQELARNAVFATGRFVRDNMLGIDDSKRLIEAAGRGDWGQVAKSALAMGWEIGTTLTFLTGFGLLGRGAQAALKAAWPVAGSRVGALAGNLSGLNDARALLNISRGATPSLQAGATTFTGLPIRAARSAQLAASNAASQIPPNVVSDINVVERTISPNLASDIGLASGRTQERIVVPASRDGRGVIDIPSYQIPGVGRVIIGADPVIQPEIAGQALLLPRSPLTIANVNPGTTEATLLRDSYLGAQRALQDAKYPDMTDLDMLVLLASKGDANARMIIESLADIGGRPTFAAPNPADFDGLFIVHNRAAIPFQTPDGSVLIRPTGDIRVGTQPVYQDVWDPEQFIKDQTNKLDNLYNTPRLWSDYVRRANRGRSPRPHMNLNAFHNGRQTIHFTLNSSVEDIANFGSWGNPYSVVAPLRSVIEANPGSLANLLRYDTYLVPAANKPLILPDATVITARPGSNRQALRSNLESQIAEEITRRGGAVFPSYNSTNTISGSVDSEIAELATRNGIRNGHHDGSPEFDFEMAVINAVYDRTARFFGVVSNSGVRGLRFDPSRRLLINSNHVNYSKSVSSNFMDRVLSGNFFSGGSPEINSIVYSGGV